MPVNNTKQNFVHFHIGENPVGPNIGIRKYKFKCPYCPSNKLEVVHYSYQHFEILGFDESNKPILKFDSKTTNQYGFEVEYRCGVCGTVWYEDISDIIDDEALHIIPHECHYSLCGES